ncbi:MULTISPECIES: DUF2911 domain-containing protein [Arenibacter]|uniref:DUF2911 domain-containing protein n=1 Tax=Arenibacter TaxID=178469 RepID=UPI001C070D3D|nr:MULTISPECIES: DUF2911 domain-containing protein [Arenibacter]MBU2904416.1 DUF2911 domain-containing protein [Arenibacter algicola]MCK0136292.1 DUF2911 domain-containing protein [Arenibacter sp. S6351L]
MKFLKWLLVVIVVLALAFFLFGKSYLTEQTKKNSPEKTATYNKNGLDLSVKYSSPFKKDRIIFGELVPYDVVWRTGANEPTTFTTATNISVGGKSLPAGSYALWTIPGKETWSFIFNSEIPEWGVTILSGGKETTRNPETDVVEIGVPVQQLSQTIESLSIDFEENEQLYLSLAWDKTKVSLPIKK